MPKFNDTTIYGDLTVTRTISGDISFNGSDTNYLTAETEVEGAIKKLDTSLALKVNISDIVNNLTSTDMDKPLSANQGKALNDTVALKVNTSDIVNNLTSTDMDKPLSANQGKVLNDTKEAIANKAVDFSVVDDMKYPTTKAVKDLIDAGGNVSIWRYE